MFTSLCIIYEFFHITTEVSSCDRDPMPHKAKNISSLAPYRKGPVTKNRTHPGHGNGRVWVQNLRVGDADSLVAMQKELVGFLDDWSVIAFLTRRLSSDLWLGWSKAKWLPRGFSCKGTSGFGGAWECDSGWWEKCCWEEQMQSEHVLSHCHQSCADPASLLPFRIGPLGYVFSVKSLLLIIGSI